MAKGKITYERGRDDNEIILRKDKGRLTLDEIFKFMHTRDMISQHEGDLVCWFFRVRSDREPPYMDDWFGDQDKGDSQALYIVGDQDQCPICGAVETLYCPECGWPLVERPAAEPGEDAGQ